jgi:hypothetical protein
MAAEHGGEWKVLVAGVDVGEEQEGRGEAPALGGGEPVLEAVVVADPGVEDLAGLGGAEAVVFAGSGDGQGADVARGEDAGDELAGVVGGCGREDDGRAGCGFGVGELPVFEGVEVKRTVEILEPGGVGGVVELDAEVEAVIVDAVGGVLEGLLGELVLGVVVEGEGGGAAAVGDGPVKVEQVVAIDVVDLEGVGGDFVGVFEVLPVGGFGDEDAEGVAGLIVPEIGGGKDDGFGGSLVDAEGEGELAGRERVGVDGVGRAEAGVAVEQGLVDALPGVVVVGLGVGNAGLGVVGALAVGGVEAGPEGGEDAGEVVDVFVEVDVVVAGDGLDGGGVAAAGGGGVGELAGEKEWTGGEAAVGEGGDAVVGEGERVVADPGGGAAELLDGSGCGGGVDGLRAGDADAELAGIEDEAGAFGVGVDLGGVGLRRGGEGEGEAAAGVGGEIGEEVEGCGGGGEVGELGGEGFAGGVVGEAEAGGVDGVLEAQRIGEQGGGPGVEGVVEGAFEGEVEGVAAVEEGGLGERAGEAGERGVEGGAGG